MSARKAACAVILLAVLPALSACSEPPLAVVTSKAEACFFEGKLSSTVGEYADLPFGIHTFDADTPTINYTTFVAAGCCEVAGVYWLREDDVLVQQFVEKTDTENFIAYAVFSLPRPAGGYQPGKYTVIVFQGGQESGRTDFTVVGVDPMNLAIS